MSEEKRLGKISNFHFGITGYQEGELGYSISFDLNDCGISTYKAFWDPNRVECTKHCKWSEEDRDKAYASIMRSISDILDKAKVNDISKLVGKPVEVTLENRQLKDWRILTEVL